MMSDNRRERRRGIHYHTQEGDVVIYKEVIAAIIGLAVKEVKGVASLAGSSIGGRHYPKGVKISVDQGKIEVGVEVNLLYGFNIPETSEKIQDKVTQTIQNMTGLPIERVHVHIADVMVQG